ncbi:MAG TPA: hypothetical protein VKL40_12375 [Candidatus Angelobacter sp.]|nr:hypothetical protein [Candidatus Angelobacter sp.]
MRRAKHRLRGIEMDEKLRRHAEAEVREYGLGERFSFRSEDFFKCDLRDATVVTLYLLTQVNGYPGPRMASQLAKGARVVSLDYPVRGGAKRRAQR